MGRYGHHVAPEPRPGAVVLALAARPRQLRSPGRRMAVKLGVDG